MIAADAQALRSNSPAESLFWRQLLVGAMRHLPQWMIDSQVPVWATLFYLRMPELRDAITYNQRWTCPDRNSGAVERELQAWRTFLCYCQRVAAAYRTYTGRPPPPALRSANHQRLREAIDRKTGVVLVTGHLGAWQLGPYLLGALDLPPLTIVMAEEPNAETQRLERHLLSKRINVHYPGSSPTSSLALLAALRRGEMVAMQIDRPHSRSFRVPLLGGQAEFSAGPAVLSSLSGAPIIPLFFPVKDRRPEVWIEGPLEPPAADNASRRAATESIALIYGQYVRRYPEQWHNFYRFFR